MSFSEFMDFSIESPCQNMCDEHPFILVPAECMRCAFLHYKKEHAADKQMAGPSVLITCPFPEPAKKRLFGGGIDTTLLQMESTQISGTSGTSDLPTSVYPELTNNELCSNRPYQNAVQPMMEYTTPAFNFSQPQNNGIYRNGPYQNTFQPAMGYAGPAAKRYPLPTTNGLGRSDLYQNSHQLAMRHFAPAAKRSYPSYFRPRTINPKLLSKMPLIISPVDDHYPERLALSPTNFPGRFARLALSTVQESISEEDAEADNEVAAYSRLTLDELRKVWKERRLFVHGGSRKRADLIARLKEDGIDPATAEAIAVRKNNVEKPPLRSRRSRKTDSVEKLQMSAFEREHLDHQAMLKDIISKTAGKILPQTKPIAEPYKPSRRSTRSSPTDTQQSESEDEDDSSADDQDEIEELEADPDGRNPSPDEDNDLEEPDDDPDKSEVGSDDEDDQPCAICLKLHSRKRNEIIFCDGCNLAVHQKCHTPPVLVIPNEDWHCRDCRPQQRENKPKVGPISPKAEKATQKVVQSAKRKRNSHQEDQGEEEDVHSPKRKRIARVIVVSDDSEEEEGYTSISSRRLAGQARDTTRQGRITREMGRKLP